MLAIFGFLKKQPPSLSQAQVEAMIEVAVARVLASVPPAVDIQPQLVQISQLEAQCVRLQSEVDTLRSQQDQLSDEVQLQMVQVPDSLNSLGYQVNDLTLRLNELQQDRDPYGNLETYLHPMRELTARMEGEFYLLKEQINEQLLGLREEIPEQQQISALIEQLVQLQVEMGKWQRTFAQELEALKQMPKAPTIPVVPAPSLGNFMDHYNAAKILLISGDSTQALQNFNQALRIDPQSADAWYYQASAQAQSGQIEAALQSLEQAITLDPSKQVLAASGPDFPTLQSNDRFCLLLGIVGPSVEDEVIPLPQVDLADLLGDF